MDRNHRNSTFTQFLATLAMSSKMIESEKCLLLSQPDFNVNDAFKVLVLAQKRNNNQISKQTFSDLELNTALLGLPGQVLSGDTKGC